jgi:hypothetical protein
MHGDSRTYEDGTVQHATIRWNCEDAEQRNSPSGTIGRIFTTLDGITTLTLVGPVTVANMSIAAIERLRHFSQPAIVQYQGTLQAAMAVANALTMSMNADATAYQTHTHPYSTAKLPYGGTHYRKGENW